MANGMSPNAFSRPLAARYIRHSPLATRYSPLLAEIRPILRYPASEDREVGAARMPSGDEFPFDFFVSRRGGLGEVAAEVAAVLEGEGYQIKLQDYDFSLGGDYVADIHDALVSARHLLLLHTADYDENYWTRKEFTNFLAALPQ